MNSEAPKYFKCFEKFPLYLPTFSVGRPPLFHFLSPLYSVGGEKEKEKKIKGNARCSAVNALHVRVIGSPNGVVAKIVEIFLRINRSKILSPLRDPPMARNSLCLFINSRDEVICADGPLHIL